MQHQADFIASNFRHTGLVGGFGSGKTKAGVIKTIVKKLQMPNIDVAYYMPTYPLIKGVAFSNFKEALTEYGIPYTLHETDKNISTPYGNIILRSMDNPDLMVGYEDGYSLVDEADVLPKDKMKKVMVNVLARNRARFKGNNNATDFVSTPEGFKFLYEFFVKNESTNKLLIKAKTKDNPYLPPGYIESLQDEYTPEELLAYLEGEFINLTSGTVYSYYNRLENHTDKEAEEGNILYVGVDFNVGNMSAIFHVIEQGNDYAIAEITKEYDTTTLCAAIKTKFPNHKIIVHPDASGKNRKTNASDTDIDILKKAGFIVKALNSNPPVKDRVGVVNKRFQTKKSFVNRFKCPDLVECLEQQPWKNGEPDKTGGLDHANDAKGYFSYYHFMRKKKIVYIG